MSVKSAGPRYRGSLTEPKWDVQVAQMNYFCDGDGTIRWDLPRPSAARDAGFEYFEDIYKPYGKGIWPYSPCFSLKKRSSDGIIYHTNTWNNAKCINGTSAGAPYTRTWGPIAYPMQSQVISALEIIPFDGNVEAEGETALISIPDHLLRKAWLRIQDRLPSIRPDTDYVVFLAELADIKEVLDCLADKTRKKIAAGAILSWNFGVKPFFAELGKILEDLRDWQKRVNGVLQGVGKIHDLAASASLDDSGDIHFPRCAMQHWAIIDGTQRGAAADATCGWHGTAVSQTRVGITVKYRYSTPDFICKMEEEVYTFLSAVGLLPNISTFWELVPFSFVADWIFNTERFFSSLGLDKLGEFVEVDILDICLTLKKTRHIKVDLYYDCTDGVPQTPCEYELNTFKRITGNKAMDRIESSLGWVKFPSLFAVMLGAALLVTNKPEKRAIKDWRPGAKRWWRQVKDLFDPSGVSEGRFVLRP